MATMPPSADKAIEIAKLTQLISLVKENQLVTALVCFCLWQIGALATAQSYVGGVMC